MASKIQLKKSNVTGRIPDPGDLDWGEIALNYLDGKLFYKQHGTGTVQVLNTDTDTITRVRGTESGTYTSGDLTLLAGTNITVAQSGSNFTISANAAAEDPTKLPLAGGTLTGQVVINAVGAASSPTLRLNTSSSAEFVHTQENLAANISSGQHAIAVIGKTSNTKNSGYIGYYWAADASNDNFVTIGHWGNDDLFRVYGNGNVTVGTNSILHAGNYNSYSPTLTGTGASGTWSISITGSSASASTATTISRNSGNIAEVTAPGSGTYNKHIIYATNSEFGIEAALATDSLAGNKLPLIFTWRGGYDALGGLKITGPAAAELGGNAVIHAGNYSSYALPLSGGTLTSTLTGVSGTTLSFSAGSGAADSYNYVLAAANDVGNRLVIFVNGSTRSADGGADSVTIRNDGGPLNLGNSGYITNLIGSSVVTATADAGTNTTQVATTQFVQTAIANLVDTAPATLDTLNELAAALGDDPNFATTVTNALAAKQPLDADLTAIAALTGTAGFLKKTAADTWALDTSTYLTGNQTITLTGDTTGSGSTSITTTTNRLSSSDDRIKAPSDDAASKLRFGFTSWNNNNTAPWADYLHLRSYADASGGTDNLVMFLKDGIGIRVWQQTFGSSTAYSTYKDVAFTDQIPTVGDGAMTVTAGTGLTGGGQLGTANQTGNSSVTITHSNSGVTAGTYNNVTVNILGHVTAGSNVAYLTAEADTLATVTARGATTSTSVSLSSTSNQYSGHFYYLPYDANGNHYPHFNDGTAGTGSIVNWRLFTGGVNSVTHQWSVANTYFDTRVESVSDMRATIFYDRDNTAYYVDPASTADTALRIRGGGLFGPNTSWGAGLYVGTNGRVGTSATVAVTNGNLHLDCEDGFGTYLNWYSNTNIYTGTSAKFGLGTASPGKKLTISRANEAASEQLELRSEGGISTGNYDGIVWTQGASGDTTLGSIRLNYNTSGTPDMSFNLRNDNNVLFLQNGGNVAIGSTDAEGYKLRVNGSFAATTKSFLIDHPTKPGKKLRYGSLEGPENGVYVRGRLRGTKIELPDYWTKLVDPDSITVQLTAVGRRQDVWVTKIENNCVYVQGTTQPDCYYFVQAERVDVEKLVVEEQ